MTVIELPWPSRDLHPNTRIHWSRRAKATKQARSDAAWLALSSGVRTHDYAGAKQLGVTLVFIPPDKRPRDTDGMISSEQGGNVHKTSVRIRELQAALKPILNRQLRKENAA